MNRKKIVSAMLIVTLTCGLGLTACGGAQGSVSGTEEAEVQRYAWPLGSSSPEDTVTQIYAEKFAEEVDRLSGGSMKISVYPNSVLGGDRELLESCKDGDIPFVVQNTAPQVTFMKDTAVFDMPALFETIDEVREHVDNLEFMELMQQVYHDGGYELLGYADQGFRVMTTNKKVESLADFKGQKIRTMENSYHMAYWKALGASPTPMTFSEVYIGLQQGTIDAQENPYEVLFQFENRQTEMLSTLHSSIPHLKFALQNIGKPSDVVSISGTLKITNIEQEILLGGRYWIIPNLPDIKQSDFIKAISAIIGTFPLFTESNGLVFVSFDTIMSNKAKALDWTRRLVATYKDNKPNAIAYSLDDFSQKNFYRWKEDDTVVGKYDGYLFVENETIESERDVVELPFAASDQFSDVAKIPIYSYDEEGNLEYNSVEPRLLAYNGVKGVFTGLDWNTLLSMYYQTYQSIIRRPIVITEKIEINDIELRDLDMTVPIYLAQYGRYYAIISIKAEDTGICECKLLQLEV